MGSDSAVIGGHDILALERFMDDTRHMIMMTVCFFTVSHKGSISYYFLPYISDFSAFYGSSLSCLPWGTQYPLSDIRQTSSRDPILYL